MTKGQEIKNSVAKDIVSLVKNTTHELGKLIQRYEKVNESFNGIKLSKNFRLLNQKGNVLLYGGRNSGKSYACIERIVSDAFELGRSSVFVLNNSALLKSRAFEVVKEYCLVNGIDCESSYNNINREIVFPNGARIKFRNAEVYINDKQLLLYENIFIDAIEQVSEIDLRDLIRKTPYNKIIATINDLSVDVSQYHLDLFPNKVRLTIEDNEFATELDYKLLDCYKQTNEKKYQEVRYGISDFWK